jgi:putative spermidine/putrescine transport system ATP-binding protein
VASSQAAVGLALDRISHRYGETLVVDAVSVAVEPGQFIALLGPSGCGKTTLLRIIAGLIAQSDGQVTIGDQRVDGQPPNERNAGIVFQNYALFPHMSVAANVGYGLRARGVDRSTERDIVERMLRLVRMETYAGRYPRELSGGQQQRIALARTLAVSPKVLLLDEPFAALDKNLRLGMQIEVKRLQRELGITTIMVTHDQAEALSLADRIAVMNGGRLEQFATPEDLYDNPATPFVAQFVGTTNLMRGTLRNGAGRLEVEMGSGGSLSIPTARPCSRVGAVLLVVRPEHLRFDPPDEDGLAAIVRAVLPQGPFVIYELSLADGNALKVTTPRSGARGARAAGEAVRVALAPDAPVRVFEA